MIILYCIYCSYTYAYKTVYKFNNVMYKYSLIKNVHSGKQDVVIRHQYIPKSTYDTLLRIVYGYL